jgi:8-oxo-dGTP pyrophosphatase MutT (NUDIX family)
MTTTMPGEYTHPDVLRAALAGEDWAERETDPARIDWPPRQERALIPFLVVEGRPVNPCELTGHLGRNEMGLWGETPNADAIVTLTKGDGLMRYLLMVERADGHGWAVPGGRIEDRETGTQAALRELAEETGLFLDTDDVTSELPARYVPDPRASDEAWAVTIPVRIDLGDHGRRGPLPPVAGADDARRAAWVRADTYPFLESDLASLYGGEVFAAHRPMLREVLDGGHAGGDPEPPARPVWAIGREPADVQEASRQLEILQGLPAARRGEILAHGLAAITHAVLALRETVADSAGGLADILDSGLVNIADEVSGTAGAVAGVAESVEDASWRVLLRQLASRATRRRRPAALASPIGGSSSR